MFLGDKLEHSAFAKHNQEFSETEINHLKRRCIEFLFYMFLDGSFPGCSTYLSMTTGIYDIIDVSQNRKFFSV